MKLLFYIPFFLSVASFSQDKAFRCGDVFNDPRDGESYQTVLIGRQCWFTRNLNTGTRVNDHFQADNGIIEKTCYENKPEMCGVFGGLYTWDEAMQYCLDVQGICPDGWKIPSRSDWEELSSFCGEESGGQKLKATPSGTPVGWDGVNDFGFNALPSGTGNHEFFKRKGQWAVYWSSTPERSGRAWFAQLDSWWYPEPPKYKNLYIGNYYLRSNGFSVRCIRASTAP